MRAAEERARVAILLSGRGSNFLALHREIAADRIPANVVAVLSDRPDAPGLDRARELGLRAVAVPRKGYSSREAHEAALLGALGEVRPDWICLAGFMRLLSASFVRRYPQRILNIHPSLLPAFAGLNAQRQALDHGVRVSGCTVHLVDEGLDSGPIVVQKAVPVFPDDTEDTLAARILEQEHVAYSEALRRLLVEPWAVIGRRISFT
jgi:phosphoribosylglycinamide formyltransferase 1